MPVRTFSSLKKKKETKFARRLKPLRTDQPTQEMVPGVGKYIKKLELDDFISVTLQRVELRGEMVDDLSPACSIADYYDYHHERPN
jgi:hypothetical protein